MAETESKKTKAPTRSRAWWNEQIAKCEKSGQTLVAYAKANGLRLGSLYKWKAALKREKSASEKRVQAEPLRFFEVAVEKQKTIVSLEFVTPRGWVVRVPSDAGNDAISRALTLVEGRR